MDVHSIAQFFLALRRVHDSVNCDRSAVFVNAPSVVMI